jgi:hypothetical protein
MSKYDHELSALDRLGLDDVQMDAALTFLLLECAIDPDTTAPRRLSAFLQDRGGIRRSAVSDEGSPWPRMTGAN